MSRYLRESFHFLVSFLLVMYTVGMAIFGTIFGTILTAGAITAADYGISVLIVFLTLLHLWFFIALTNMVMSDY